MEEKKHLDPSEIGPKHVDIEKILAAKKVKLPHWAVRLLERILHADEINSTIYRHRDKFGLDFVHAFLEGNEPQDLQARIEVVNPEYIPREGYPIVAGNHPLGGPDGLALMAAVGRYREDIQFPVNDFLLYLPGLAPLFVPIDKVNRNTANVNAFYSLPWDARHERVIRAQMDAAEEQLIVPGGYFTGRHIINAWNRVCINNENARDALEKAVKDINKELHNKRVEFGLE